MLRNTTMILSGLMREKMKVKQGSTYSKGVRAQFVVGENSKEGKNILDRGTKSNMWLHMGMKQGSQSLMEQTGSKQGSSGLWVYMLELWLDVLLRIFPCLTSGCVYLRIFMCQSCSCRFEGFM